MSSKEKAVLGAILAGAMAYWVVRDPESAIHALESIKVQSRRVR